MNKTIDEISYIICFLLDKQIAFWYDVDDITISGDIKVKSHLKELIERGFVFEDDRLKVYLKDKLIMGDVK